MSFHQLFSKMLRMTPVTLALALETKRVCPDILFDYNNNDFPKSMIFSHSYFQK